MNLQIISGSSNLALSKKVSNLLKIQTAPTEISRFADGEIYVHIKKKVRGDDIFLIQSVSPYPSINDNLLELLITIDALKRASAGRINVIAPYLGYSRQDRKALPREPITAKLVANLITAAGADRICTMDLHKDQIQGFYDIPFDHLVAYPMFAEYLKKQNLQDIVVVSPDIGAVGLARKLATLLKAPIAIVDKRRPNHNKSEILNIIGDVKGLTAILLDDIVDTGGTITSAANALKKIGAVDIKICATHALLSKDAVQKLQLCEASEALFMDSVSIPKEKLTGKIKQLSMAKLLSKVINRIHNEQSLGELFDWEIS